MATYTAPTTRASGDLITASIWNTDLVENIKYFKDSPSITALTTSGAATIGTTLTAGTSIVTSVSGVGSITDRANSTTSVEVHIRPLSGKSGYLSFTEDSVADRWVIHSKTGSGTLGIASGSSSSHTDRVAITSGGNIAIGTTAKIYLDSVAGTGDTYISESASNVLSLYSGGVESKLTSGVLTVSGYGTHNFSTSGTGYNTLQVQNTNTANASGAALILDGDSTTGESYIYIASGATEGYLEAFAQSFTTSGASIASSVRLLSQSSGGLTLHASHASGVIRFYTGGLTTERMRIDTSGNLAIASGAKLLLDGTAATGDTYITEYTANGFRLVTGGSDALVGNSSVINIQAAYVNTTGSAANLVVLNAGGEIARSTSSIRYKHDVETLDAAHAIASVMQMRPVTYRGKTDENQRRYVGFIAEEMVGIAPLLTTYDEGGESGTPNYVTYDRVTAYLVAVVQQQQAEIDALKARLN